MPSASQRQSFLEASLAELRDRHVRIERDRRRELGALDPDFSEQAVQSENDQVLDGLERSVDQDIQQIEHALERIRQGQGEHCEACGAPIGAPRLKALPQATRCARCADSAAA